MACGFLRFADAACPGPNTEDEPDDAEDVEELLERTNGADEKDKTEVDPREVGCSGVSIFND